jgi:glycosyltransferase involved in cell wall biosynthesis
MEMVIGSGAIAQRFIDYSLQSKYLLFVGNANDAAITNEVIYNNEERDVFDALQKFPAALFVYFSSCSILDRSVAHTPYVQHKIRMENLIRNSGRSFLILRLPQLLALSDTDSSLISYLVSSIANQKHFELWKNAKKNVIDIDDVHAIVGALLDNRKYTNKIINIASPQQISASDLVHHIENFLGVKANYSHVEKGSAFDIEISEIKPIIRDLSLDFDGKYIESSLRKYFSHYLLPPKTISVIVPTYNEWEGIDEFYRRTKNVLKLLQPRFAHEIIFVDDFSTDNTAQKLQLLAEKDPSVKLISFSRNFGNQIAITAGIDFCRGDLAVIIDDDLQDPPEVILNFIAKWDQGYKVVYGVRPIREGVNPIFKLLAKSYYRLIGKLSETDIPTDTGDFRLVDRVAIDALKSMRERGRYYRGMVAWVGFSQIGVVYERDKRFAGKSTFSFSKYINFAITGLTSFTDKPLYFSAMAGFFFTVFSFLLAITLVVNRMVDPSVTIRGWTSLMVIVLFFGGVQLLSIGIVGVYISKIYRETKGRPLYIIDSTENFDHEIRNR